MIRRPTFALLQEILRRQAGPTRWGQDYLPSYAITDRECPQGTRPSCVADANLNRATHLQALTERVFFLLARHYPNLLDLHEQKMLFFGPAAHPLSNHPAALGLQLPGLRGTLEIADELGKLKDHVMVRAPKDHPVFQGKLLPFPYVGDFLLYLQDSVGPYGVNWSIKACWEDFHRPHRRRRTVTPQDREKEEFRHELERLYYLDGAIPTHQLVPSLIDKELSVNLLNLYYWYARAPLSERAAEIREEVAAWYCEQIPSGRLMHDHAKTAAKKFGIDVYDAKWILKSGIFTRKIRVELFCVVADNLPLMPERHDPFSVYAEWFGRLS